MSPSFCGRILSIYSELNKFEISKDLTFQNSKNKLKKCMLKGKFKYKEAVCFPGYSL